MIFLLEDVPVARHLIPLIGVSESLLTAPFYVHAAEDAVRARALARLPEDPVSDELARDLLALAQTLALEVFAGDAQLLGRTAGSLSYGFHPGISLATAHDVLAKVGFCVVRYSHFVAERSQPRFRAESRTETLVEEGTPKSPLPLAVRAGLALSEEIERWDAASEETLRAFLRRAPGSTPVFSPSSLESGLDRSELLSARLMAADGRTEAQILGSIARGRFPRWPSVTYFLTGRLARLDAVLDAVAATDPAIAPAVLERIFEAAEDLAAVPAVRRAVLAFLERGAHASLFTAGAIERALNVCGDAASAEVTEAHLRRAEESEDPDLLGLATRLANGAPDAHVPTLQRAIERTTEPQSLDRQKQALHQAARAGDASTVAKRVGQLKANLEADIDFAFDVLAILVEQEPSLDRDDGAFGPLVGASTSDRADSVQSRRAAELIVRGMQRHPNRIWPLHFGALSCLGHEQIPLLLDLLDAALASAHVENEREACATRARIEAAEREGWNPEGILFFGSAARTVHALSSVDPSEARPAIQARARRWSDAMTWTFASVARYVSRDALAVPSKWRDRLAGNALLLAVFEVAPHGEGRDALRDVLARVGRLPKGSAKPARSPLPRRLPLDLAEALALRGSLSVEDAVPLRPPRTGRMVPEAAFFPDGLRALYRMCDGVGDRAVVSSAELAALQARFTACVESHLEEAEGEEAIDFSEAIDLRCLLPVERLLALGMDASGDFFFVASNVRVRGGGLPILRFRHDELCTVCPHSRSLGEFVSRLSVAAYNRRHGPDERAEGLLREGGFRVIADA